MSLISKTQLIKDVADAYRTASGTSELVRYDELASKIEELGGRYPINVTFMNGENEWAKVGATENGKIAEPVQPTGQGVFTGWGLGSSRTPIQFPYIATDGNVFNALYSSLADQLYSFYEVDKTIYPVIFINCGASGTTSPKLIEVVFSSDIVVTTPSAVGSARIDFTSPVKRWVYSNLEVQGEHTASNICEHLFNATKPVMGTEVSIIYIYTGRYVLSNTYISLPSDLHFEQI